VSTAEARPYYDEPLKPYNISQRASELLGDETSGNIAIVNNLLERMQKRPDTNLGTSLEVQALEDAEAKGLQGQDLQLERGYRIEANQQALATLCDMYDAHDSTILVEQDCEPDELWLTITHKSSLGFEFKEIWGYAPGHQAGDYAPDTYWITAEAIRQPDSEFMQFK